MKLLFRQVDIASLVFFRILFGILAFADVTNQWIYYQLIKKSFQPENFQFKYFWFEWVRSFSEPWMSLGFIILTIAAVFIVLGKWYRVSTTVFAVGFTWLFLLEKAHYLNHGYLFCWISWIMIFLPAHRAFSADVLKRPTIRLKTIPFWSMAIMPFLMGVVYFYGGIAKINSDWLRAMPLKNWLAAKADMPLLGGLWAQEWVAWFMSYSGMLFDLLIPFLLLWRRTRWFGLAMVLFFHSTNHILFNIGIFPFLSLVLSLMFFPPDFPRRVISFFKTKFDWVLKLENWWNRKLGSVNAPAPGILSNTPFQRKWTTAALALIVIFHLAYPFRHQYFEGRAAWTEEGHRFSWRMMLRSKSGHGHFWVKDPSKDKKYKVRPNKYLTDKQVRKMFTHPDMILQFAHLLRDDYAAKGVEAPEVYAEIRARLNGRNYQTYIDPEVDLAKIEWSPWQVSEWIVPLEKN